MTKKYFYLILIITSILTLSFATNSFSEYPLIGESNKPNKSSEVEGIKPNISIELTTEPPPKPPSDEGEDLEEEFEDIDGGEEEEINDPIEPFNRLMWSFNENLYDYALEPVARGYSKVVPEKLRGLVKNFFSNIASPIHLVSSIIQGNKEKAGRSIGRFLVNTTFGMGGLFDPASSIFKMEKVNEDLDQALGYYNVPSGPFIMLPILGPTTLRGVVGKIPQIFLGPEFLLGIPVLPATGARGAETINDVSLNLDRKDDLDLFAIDPYTSVKDYYYQRQKVLIDE